MDLMDAWCKKWQVSKDALDDLADLLVHTIDAGDSRSEADIMQRVRLRASKLGMRLWRNNVGAAYMQDGSFVRYGLANDSAQLNAAIKSADLIGIRPILITEQDIGRTIGQFVSREIKSGNWKYRGTKREQAQLAWARVICMLGGDAKIINNEEELL